LNHRASFRLETAEVFGDGDRLAGHLTGTLTADGSGERLTRPALTTEAGGGLRLKHDRAPSAAVCHERQRLRCPFERVDGADGDSELALGQRPR
jgi:hypothetical protein